MLVSKEAIATSQRQVIVTAEYGNKKVKQEKGIVRAVYGSKMDF